jgi:hypothetical protein
VSGIENCKEAGCKSRKLHFFAFREQVLKEASALGSSPAYYEILPDVWIRRPE